MELKIVRINKRFACIEVLKNKVQVHYKSFNINDIEKFKSEKFR